MEIFDLRSSFTSDKVYDEICAEKERYSQAHELITYIMLYTCDPRKPGELVRKFGHRLSRLHELKAYHFIMPRYKIC